MAKKKPKPSSRATSKKPVRASARPRREPIARSGAQRWLASVGSGLLALVRLPFHTRRSTEWTLTVVLIGAMAGGWLYAKPKLIDHIASTHADPVRIRLAVPADPNNPSAITPAIPPEIVPWLTGMVAQRVSNDTFSIDDLEAARIALLNTGWLSEGLTLERQPRGVVAVHGKWRPPAAIVHDGKDRYLIAADSSPLRVPVGFAMSNTAYAIRSPSHPPPRREPSAASDWRVEIAYGQPWPGTDVKAALELLGLIDQSPVRAQVLGVDLAEFPNDGHLVLITDTGSRIVWGSPANADGTVPAGEQPIAERLRRMEAFLQTHRRIDAGHDNLLIYTPTVLTTPAGPRTARP